MTSNTLKHPTVAVGDWLRCTKHIQSLHHQYNDEVIVEEESLVYYQHFTGINYEIIKRVNQ
jgi:hypothetical protein